MSFLNFRSFFLILSLTICSSACVNLQRSHDSGYAENSRAGARGKVIRSSSIDSNVKKDSADLSIRDRLKNLENSLTGKKEIEQYSKALPWFENEEERAEFLSLLGFEQRQQWMQNKNFPARANKSLSSMQSAVEDNDIVIGMPQPLVIKSWGEPESVEVSGNPKFKNERWKYSRYISTQDGYKAEKKIVYFEGGKVVGWEVE